MKKQVFALLASGLLLASAGSFAEGEDAAPGTNNTNVTGGGVGGLSTGSIVVGAVAIGAAAAALSDGGGDSSGTGGTTGTTGTTGTVSP